MLLDFIGNGRWWQIQIIAYITENLVVKMQTLSSLVAPEVVMMTTSGATSDDKVGIKNTLGFQRSMANWTRSPMCEMQEQSHQYKI